VCGTAPWILLRRGEVFRTPNVDFYFEYPQHDKSSLNIYIMAHKKALNLFLNRYNGSCFFRMLALMDIFLVV